MVATRAFPAWGLAVHPEKLRGFNGLPARQQGMGEAFDVSTSAPSGVAGRYANALFELADNARSLDQVAHDLTTFRAMQKAREPSRGFRRFQQEFANFF